MSKPRHKKVLHAIHTRAEVDAAVSAITDATIALREHQNALDADIKSAREAYQEEIDDLKQLIDDKTDLLALWAQSHPAEFTASRSIVTTHGTIGFRLGNWAFKYLPGITPKIVVDRLKRLGKSFAAYVRIKEEVNQQAIVADRVGISPKTMTALGFAVVQEETFFVEPDLAKVEARQILPMEVTR